MATQFVQRVIARAAIVLLFFGVTTIGIPAFSEWEDQYCDPYASPSYCAWSNGEDCSEFVPACSDFCDMHGGVSQDACDEIGGSCFCLS